MEIYKTRLNAVIESRQASDKAYLLFTLSVIFLIFLIINTLKSLLIFDG